MNPINDAVVPFLNLKQLYVEHRAEFDEAIKGILDTGAYIGGDAVRNFETNFSRWVGEGVHTVGCANGTDAITVAVKALGLSAGAEAIIPAMTFAATAFGLINAGIKVRLVDIEEGSYGMSPQKLGDAFSKETKLVIPVHLYGQMARMDAIQDTLRGRDCTILEDAAQCHGAKWKGNPIGFYGKVATTSFYPGKNLGAFGDAGAIVTRDAKIAERCQAIKNQGGIKKYEHVVSGCNSRLDALQAAVLDVKLKYIDGWNERRRQVAHWYQEFLSDVPDVKLPVALAEGRHVYHLYVIQIEKRDELAAYLTQGGIQNGIHYPKAIHELEALREKVDAGPFPVAECLARHGLSLPMCPTLTVEQVRRSANRVRAYFGKKEISR